MWELKRCWTACYFWRPRRVRRRIKYGMQSATMMPIITSVGVLIFSLLR